MFGRSKGPSDKGPALPGTIRQSSRSGHSRRLSEGVEEAATPAKLDDATPASVAAPITPASIVPAATPPVIAPELPPLDAFPTISGGSSSQPASPATSPKPSSSSPDVLSTDGFPSGLKRVADAVDRVTPPVVASTPSKSVQFEPESPLLPPGVSPNIEPDPTVLPSRTLKFQRLFDSKSVDLEALRKLCWSGIPRQYRMYTWQLLLGYLPSSRDRHASAMDRKRQDYRNAVAQCFGPAFVKNDKEQALLRQVLVDLPRTCPGIPLFHTDFVQRSLERVLFVWALRHPASGYVQGINDLATPLYAVFLEPYATLDSTSISATEDQLLAVEADVYWCLTRILDGMLDHFTPSQPGLQRMMYRLQELVCRVDADLAAHLSSMGVEFMQFSFRWMNCKLLREIPFPLVIRLWDTYFCEPSGFEDFHVYVCTALLLRFSTKLKSSKVHEDVIGLLQKLPTDSWTVKDIEEILSQAYIYQTAFQSARSHLA